ncbi:MAG: hypothetical protein CXX80_10780 [Methanobacteriota archaeon]|nr:MAG: hypothetical protein CXX80_10780 [Euryarchaeota archaeon]HIB59442.1 hypothetical protein [Candidatus Poseidoniales archaeon]
MSTHSTPPENTLRSLLVTLLIVLQASLFIPPAVADGGVVQTFSGGFAEVTLSLQGNNSVSSIVSLPRNATFATASFEISTDHEDNSPGNVWLDIDEDGFWEWAWNGTGHGVMSKQAVFTDGASNSSIQISSNSSQGQGFILPPSASISSTSLNVSFSPEVGGGLWQFGTITDIETASVDGDALPEVIVLNESASGAMVGVFEWNSSTQTMTSNWVTTCDNATDIRVGDIDNDGDDDIGVFDSSEMQMCVHFANALGLSAVSNYSLPSGSIDAHLADLDGDGSAELISASSGGDLNLRVWDSGSGAFGENQTQMVEANESAGMPAQLNGLITGEFHGVGNDSSVVVFDSMGHATLWNWSGSAWIGPMNFFDGIKGGTLVHDFDSNGYADIIGTADGMVTLALFNGTGWNATLVTTTAVDFSHIGDYDGNGQLEILTANAGTPDGSDTTFTGSIFLRHLNGTTIAATSTFVLQPWTSPKQILLADVNGDGTDEHIVVAGESQAGIFVSAWHSLSIDANNDSVAEATVRGYSGDGQRGLEPLYWLDMENTIEQAISPLLMTLGSGEDDYGNDLAIISPAISANGVGQALLQDLEVLYDVTLTVDANPHISANLTNVFNQKIQLGNGTFNLELPFNSTAAGPIKLGNMLAIWNPGAPNIAVPIKPKIVLETVNSTGVFFHWQNISFWGEDLLNFQVFKTSSGGEFDFTSPISSSIMNQSFDLDVVVGQSYDYAVRSIHQFGVTSNLSDRLVVTIPFPAPPDDVSGIVVSDVGSDNGGQINVGWSENTDTFDHYSIYVHDLGASGPVSFANLNAALNISAGNSNAILSMTSAVLDGLGQVITASAPLDHNSEYWVAVIAADQYGNQTFTATSVGPVIARNDTVVPAEITLGVDIVDAGSGEAEEMLIRQSAFFNGTLLTLNATLLLDGLPAEGQPIAIQMTDGNIWFNYSGMTNSSGVMSQFTGEPWGTVVGSNAVGGEITITATYVGNAGSTAVQPISSAVQQVNTTAGIEASLSLLDDDVEVSSDGTAVMQLILQTADSGDQAILTATNLLWAVGNGSDVPTSTGQVSIDSSGQGAAAVLLADGGWFNATFTPPAWLIVNPSLANPLGQPWANATLRPYPYTDMNGNGSNNDTQNQSTELITPTLNCDSWSISNLYDGNQSKTECTLTNPNDVAISVDWSTDLWTAPTKLRTNPSKVSLSIPAGGNITFDLIAAPTENLTLASGQASFQIEGTAQSLGLPDLVLEYTITYTIVDDIGGVNGGNGGNGNASSNTSDDKSSGDESKMLMYALAGGGGILALLAIVFIIVRLTREEEEDWDEDDLEFDDPDAGYGRAGRPDDLPIGYALDEIKPKRSAKRPSVIVEDISEEEAGKADPFNISRDTPESDYGFEEGGEYDEYSEGGDEQESFDESEQGDDGISTDDEGTEWWEDEEGVWWYRTSEMEDWAEYVE